MAAPARTRRTRFGPFEVDWRSGELYKHGIRLKLQDQPFQVLAVLLEHAGDVVTREELRQKLWPADTFVDFDTGLNRAINKLRDVLCDSAEKPRYIETLPRRGYRFIALIDALSASPDTDLKVAQNLAEIDHGQLAPQNSEYRRLNETEAAESSRFAVVAVPQTRLRGIRIALFLGLIFAALVSAGIFVRLSSRSVPDHAGPIKSLVVLPLENLTGDPSQEYFVDGMTDAVTTELAQHRGLRVISRTSAMHYKGATKKLPEIARELNVDAVVEGAVANSGNAVKITTQLIRASTDTHLWASSYTRTRQDALQVQADVARDVARQIGDQLVPLADKPGSRLAVNPDAYDAYLKGAFFENKGNPDAIRTAIRYLQSAAEKDPTFALAYARLSECYSTLSLLSEMPTSEAQDAAKLAAQKAVALDDDLDRGHIALARIALSDWNWTRAENEYKRAIQLNANSADAHTGYSYLLLILGRLDEAGQHEQAALAVDPLSITALNISVFGAYHRRQYDDGLVKARNAIELYPQQPMFHDILSNFYAVKGQAELSGQEILLSEEASGASPERLAALRAAFDESGLKGLRRKRIELNKKVASKKANTYDIAIDCAAVGDGEQAIAWLEKAFQAHDSKISLIGVEPIFDGIRSDPRFISLLRQMGLSPTSS